MNKSILHIFASVGWGGGEQYILDLAKRQIAAGCRLTLLSAMCNIIKNKTKTLQCNHIILKYRWHFNPLSVLKLHHIILQNQVEIVHVHIFKDAFIAAFATRFIASYHRPKIIMTRHLVKKGKNNCLYKWLYEKLDKLIFVSELAKNEFMQGISLPDGKITVIHNSIPECSIVTHDIDYRARFGLDSHCLLVGFTGRIVQYKGVELIIDIAEKLYDRNVAFFLAGKGDKEYESFIQNIICKKRQEARVFLLGFLDNTAEFVASMDVGLLPSLWHEPFGLSVLEFMRAGLPVITSNTGAQTEFIIHEETGLTVFPELETMAMILIELIDNKHIRHYIGNNALSYYEKYLNYNIFFNHITNVYEE